MKTKIQSLLQQLNQGLVEREHVLKLAMLTTLAGENLVLVGPPGTGKSLVARRIAQSLSHEGEGGGAGYFEYLLTKFSTPEELFGPLSISALKADRFHRNTEGYLPTVRMAFLDEIFKASSSILNALLTVLNERVYHNGTQVQKVPLQALIAASNELPTDQEELAALYDRFLVRVFVDYVGANNLPRLFETTTEPTLRTEDRLSAADLARVRQAADQVVFEPALIQAVQDIWAAHKEAFKEDRRESLSDRRLKKVIHLMRVSAATNGREAVDLSDLMLLKDCLWNHADNAPKVRELVIKTLQCHSRQVPVALSDQSQAPAYELGGDGKTLVLTKLATTLAVAKGTTPAHAPRRSGAVVKGYVGSGTADDPLLIQSVDDLIDLARPYVGQQGYHFRQTADLDIRKINIWPEFDFNGHYEGQGHIISDGAGRWLFRNIRNGRVAHLRTQKLGLAKWASQSEFFACRMSGVLINIARNCKILSCEAGDRLISSKANDCDISFCATGKNISGSADGGVIRSCRSSAPLFEHVAKNTKISDCLVVMDVCRTSDPKNQGGIATELINSTTECCLVVGKWDGFVNFSGIAHAADTSNINRCALGNFDLMGSLAFWQNSIVAESSNSLFDRNFAIDSIDFDINKFRHWGGATIGAQNTKSKSIAAAQFTQRFFEHTLDWDFDQVWIWDDQNDRPALRQAGIDAIPTSTGASASAKASSTVDLLTQQFKANIWL
ncbi:AAA family ATPase [uncultured Sphaerotilus sp.]|uniref:AAA family ATPase n=1 Tax=uncultured Sphaerotilus sp. TaxID=474984 RepID=UPI0030CA4114